MPASVVFGGQFGSEGKGKIACWLAEKHNAAQAIRVGGSNSGHTVIGPDGNRTILRHLPTAAVLPSVKCLLAAGSYIDPDVFQKEIRKLDLHPERVVVDPNASVITEKHKEEEATSDLRESVASTLSGTGASVRARIARSASFPRASGHPTIAPYVGPVKKLAREALDLDRWVVVEGTQGFGLSLLHARHYPYVTSRDTTAAGFLAEAGLSPADAHELVMVLRAFPIRVGGPSGPLPREINWQTVTNISGSPVDLQEMTSVTNTIRRVAKFDPKVVKEAIRVNQPSRIVMNHLDYVDWTTRQEGRVTRTVKNFLLKVEEKIDCQIDYLGFGPRTDQLLSFSEARSTNLQDKPTIPNS